VINQSGIHKTTILLPKDTVSPFLRKVGARIRRLREERALSQERLAAVSSINDQV
jgi:ribosome-binding protein aMBF1 (putative translation factor)